MRYPEFTGGKARYKCSGSNNQFPAGIPTAALPRTEEPVGGRGF